LSASACQFRKFPASPTHPAPGAARVTRTGKARMNALLWLFNTVIQLYIYILIASAVLSWLVAFNVVNVSNPIVSQIGEFLYRVTEPVLRPIRNLLPNLGGVDISPIILILLLLFVQKLITDLYIQVAF
jgi:YggT family protein